jgi:hypothetical protein
MKTPRDTLFQRHQAAAPKLDAIRREVMAGLNHQDAKAQRGTVNFLSLCLGGSNKLWLELVWPCRRIWAGLAAVWILIFAVNFSQRDPAEMMARKSPPPSPEIMLAFRQQEMLLAELTDQKETPIAEPPKQLLPQPRSERRIEILMT